MIFSNAFSLESKTEVLLCIINALKRAKELAYNCRRNSNGDTNNSNYSRRYVFEKNTNQQTSDGSFGGPAWAVVRHHLVRILRFRISRQLPKRQSARPNERIFGLYT